MATFFSRPFDPKEQQVIFNAITFSEMSKIKTQSRPYFMTLPVHSEDRLVEKG